MPSAAIGAIVAACIAAAVSLLGLIISKEQKTSEFRQAWIDALRAEFVTYLTNVNSISDMVQHPDNSGGRKLEILSPLFSALNSASFNISLRLNRDEVGAKAVFAAMKEFEELFSSGDIIESRQIRPIEQKFLKSSQDLLRSEWKRVKSGEITFRVAKYSCAIVLVGALLYGSYFVMWRGASRVEAADAAAKDPLVNIVVSPNAEAGHEVSQVAPVSTVRAENK